MKKDYIIFEKAPKITFTCDVAIHDWYANTTEMSERTKISGMLTTSDCADSFIIQDASAEIKIRGNYTASYNKKPFQIKFAEKQNLFGLNNGNSHKKWVLLAEYNDSSMLRNALAFYMGQQLLKGVAWVPTFTFAHFYIQDSEQLYYMGLYLLCDQKEQGSKRVDVFEPEDGYEGTDIGYFFERDDYYATEDDPTFVIDNSEYVPEGLTRTTHESNQWARQAHGVAVDYDGFSIKSKITNAESQVPYLKDRMLKIYEILYRAVNENALYELDAANNLSASTEMDPVKCLDKTIDMKSFVDMYILHEIACNPDIGHSSFHFSLDMSAEGNKRLTLACPWDFDLALGIAKHFADDPASAGLWAKECTLNPWISLLVHADWFKTLVDERWQELYDHGVLYKGLQLLDDYSTTYQSDFETNFTEWDIHFASGQNKTWNMSTTTPKTFIWSKYYNASDEATCKGYLSDWVNGRFTALHSLFNGQGEPVWPEPPEADASAFRKDKLVQLYTQEEWNAMYANPTDDMSVLWNQLYESKEDPDVEAYNSMYGKVEGSKPLDPEDQVDCDSWNENAAR